MTLWPIRDQLYSGSNEKFILFTRATGIDRDTEYTRDTGTERIYILPQNIHNYHKTHFTKTHILSIPVSAQKVLQR